MEYFIVTRYKECVSTLTDQDDVAACGTNWVSGWAGLQALTTAVRQADMRSNGVGVLVQMNLDFVGEPNIYVYGGNFCESLSSSLDQAHGLACLSPILCC